MTLKQWTKLLLISAATAAGVWMGQSVGVEPFIRLGFVMPFVMPVIAQLPCAVRFEWWKWYGATAFGATALAGGVAAFYTTAWDHGNDLWSFRSSDIPWLLVGMIVEAGLAVGAWGFGRAIRKWRRKRDQVGTETAARSQPKCQPAEESGVGLRTWSVRALIIAVISVAAGALWTIPQMGECRSPWNWSVWGAQVSAELFMLFLAVGHALCGLRLQWWRWRTALVYLLVVYACWVIGEFGSLREFIGWERTCVNHMATMLWVLILAGWVWGRIARWAWAPDHKATRLIADS